MIDEPRTRVESAVELLASSQYESSSSVVVALHRLSYHMYEYVDTFAFVHPLVITRPQFLMISKSSI